MAQAQTFEPAASSDAATRAAWMQLLLGFIVMMTISSPQYVWTLFVPSFQKTTGAILSEVQWTITLLIVLQTWLSPLQGYLVEKLGPKLLIGLGALMSGAGWIASSYITTLWGLYATYGLLCGSRHRHRLHRHHRADGEMVSGRAAALPPAWSRRATASAPC